jgi:hypothetical protein
MKAARKSSTPVTNIRFAFLPRFDSIRIATIISQVFDDPNASDPSHSILSKVRYVATQPSYIRLKDIQDHFALILNEPAGKVAQVVDEYAVNLIVRVSGDDFITSICTNASSLRLGQTIVTRILFSML